MRRVVWFGVGVGVSVLVSVQVRRYLRRASPQALGARARDSASGIGDSVRKFTAEVRAAMAEREQELRAALGQPPQP